MKKELDLFFEYSLWELLSNESPHGKNTIENFLKTIRDRSYAVYISNGCIERTNSWEAETKDRFKKLAAQLKPINIVPNREINELALEYKKYDIFPSDNDILYTEIVSAVVNNIPVLVTVDHQYLIKYETKMKVKGINQLLGYQPLEIISPKELTI